MLTRLRRFCGAVMMLVFVASPLHGQPRGYQARPSGWDLDFNGRPGDASGADVAVCDGAGGTNEDIDGNGVNDRQVYVDLGSGFDHDSCGSPAGPCLTLQYAMSGSNTQFSDRIQAPLASQIQAVCFKGRANATVAWTRSGATGTHTRAATGSQARAFEYPRYPFILSGWDADGDNSYPPHDVDDVAVVDGNMLNDAPHFILPYYSTIARVEVAHFTARDYGRACPANSGFAHLDTGSHLYYHDLELIDINRGCAGNSGTILFDNFVHGGNLRYAAIENVQAANFAGYFLRGGAPAGTNGPYRLQNIDSTVFGLSGSFNVAVKPWGEIDGFEILDSIWDLNGAAWNAVSASGLTGLNPSQCVRDVDIVNNEILDYRVSISVQPSASGACSARNMDAITITRNVIRNTYQAWGAFGHTGIEIQPPDSPGLPTVENIDITNNFISSTNPNWQAGVLSSASSSTAQPGLIRIVGNTIWGTAAKFDAGAIGICSWGACASNPQQTYLIRNNIIGGGAAGGSNIEVGYVPAAWDADGNILQSSMNYVWNGMTHGTLSAYQVACSGGSRTCEPNSTESCSPSFAQSLTGDFHLASGDSCAIDRGIDASAVSSVDIDNETRPRGIAWDVGADEFGSGQRPSPPTNLRIVP